MHSINPFGSTVKQLRDENIRLNNDVQHYKGQYDVYYGAYHLCRVWCARLEEALLLCQDYPEQVDAIVKKAIDFYYGYIQDSDFTIQNIEKEASCNEHSCG